MELRPARPLASSSINLETRLITREAADLPGLAAIGASPSRIRLYNIPTRPTVLLTFRTAAYAADGARRHGSMFVIKDRCPRFSARREFVGMPYHDQPYCLLAYASCALRNFSHAIYDAIERSGDHPPRGVTPPPLGGSPPGGGVYAGASVALEHGSISARLHTAAVADPHTTSFRGRRRPW